MSMQKIREDCFDKLTALPLPQHVADRNDLPMGAKLLLSCFWEKLPVHDRRTLDQAFYYTMDIKKIWKRNQEQVLWRYMSDENVPESERRILMVDQLWVWVIDAPKTLADGAGGGPSTSPFFPMVGVCMLYSQRGQRRLSQPLHRGGSQWL